jgi:hypothetical protein
MELQGVMGHVVSHFGRIGDSVGTPRYLILVEMEHTVGLEIVLDPPGSTLRWRISTGCLIQFIWYIANLDGR